MKTLEEILKNASEKVEANGWIYFAGDSKSKEKNWGYLGRVRPDGTELEFLKSNDAYSYYNLKIEGDKLHYDYYELFISDMDGVCGGNESKGSIPI